MATARKSPKQAAEEIVDDIKAEAHKRSLEDDIKILQKEVQRLAEQLTKTGRHSFETARKAASVGAEQIKSQGESAYADMRTGAENLEAQLTQAVREKPVTALAMAAGVGFLFALISRR
jgi:ElaB/YqjD/DUF883 family membrane-anchored ribosome-binding protein